MCVGDSIGVSKVYRSGETGQSIEIAPGVMVVFERNQQTTSSAPEAGGLLFARISPNAIQIVSATEPTKSDIRSRFLFRSSRQKAKIFIEQKFKEGLHFVGEWHTHPEADPTPSRIDIVSMAEAFSRSKHQLDHFIMIIVGNQIGDMRLWVSIHNRKHVIQLSDVKKITNSKPLTIDSE